MTMTPRMRTFAPTARVQTMNSTTMTNNSDNAPAVDLRKVVKTYDSPSGSFTALQDINCRSRQESLSPWSVSPAAGRPLC